MPTGRLEAFSDGVFAIAATLLVLEIRVGGDGGESSLADALVDLWPSYLAYATSFLTIAVIWVNHHAIVSFLGTADRGLQFINSLLLLLVAFVPFPTRLVAENLQHDNERTAAVFYGLVFVAMAIVFQLWWRYASRGRYLIRDDVSQEALDDVTRSFNPGVPLYAAATALSLAVPLAGVVAYLAIALFYGLPLSLLRRLRR